MYIKHKEPLLGINVFVTAVAEQSNSGTLQEISCFQ